MKRPVGGQWTILAPMTERGEVIGLLELPLVPQEPGSLKRSPEIARLAHLLAFVVIANRRHTDLYEWGQRSRRSSLSAEIQQRLLPGPAHLRGGCVHPLGVAGAGSRDRRRHLRLQPGPRPTASVDDRRHGTRCGCRADGQPVCRGAAGRAPARLNVARAGDGRERGAGRAGRRGLNRRLRHWPDRALGPTRGLA